MTVARRDDIPQHRLGAGGPAVSALGYGAMGLSGVYGAADDAESERLIHHLVEAGITLIDTADVYGNGHNEQLIGRALSGGLRDRVVLATKTGAGGGEGLGRPERIHQAIDSSLKRLGTDRIDLYYLHRVDPSTPIEDSVGAIAEAVQQGKVGHIGISEVSADTLRRAHSVHPIAVTQEEYSLFTRDVEAELLPAARELGVGLVAYSPLGRGVLGGSIRSAADVENLEGRQARYPRFAADALEQNLSRVDRLRARAEELGTTPAALALGWLIAQGEDVVPIPGTRRAANLDANLEAARLVLPAEVVAELSEIFPPGSTAGERYTANLRGGLGR
ncbi:MULTISPECIES: aldo/keto reductase [unclassified Saccharopolyspora]|uniref:aldo/keto reductase n=1 Tax=unclassified Saccharopolyspora TaxID=2646250 RepID=UPI001CD7050E|nr:MULTISPECIES: aldo/keto reductase [unclassified Saccharopolyspora]MCA1185279.1 aldo/keto reductase [Saccharopolyspora sp. 6T]MCA1224618.1 aldo/keto reductase [Saccharopolyspora sp. 6M]